jgi:hypothetical protein
MQNDYMPEEYVGIMQPYFFPYVGYFQLINKCQKFVIYDDVQFTKKGWVTRNKLLGNSSWTISVNCNSSPVETIIKEKVINQSFDPSKIIRRIQNEYIHSAYLQECMELLESTFRPPSDNLFEYLNQTLRGTLEFLELKGTEIFVSSDLAPTQNLHKEEKIFALMDSLQTKNYLNPLSGSTLYNQQVFIERQKRLFFLSPELDFCGTSYNQSIIHLLLTLGKTKTKELITQGRIVEP